MKDTMTLSVTAYGKTVTITQPDDIDIYEFLNTCKSLAMAIEYESDSWKNAILTEADEITYEDDQRMIDEYETDVVKHEPSGNIPYNPIMTNQKMWLHKDGTVRDYPDVDNITLPSTC
jgi:hypothetical protein